jgi:NTE family protein
MLKIFLILPLLFILNAAKGQIDPKPIRNLVFEGGGIRGIAYAGALMELEKHHLLDSIQRMAGTSAGAIAATLYAIGYSPEEIADLTAEVKIKSFADGRWIFIGGSRRLIRNFGWYRGEKFTKWMSKLIKDKTGKENITLEELHQLSLKENKFKSLYVTGTNLSLQTSTVLSHETFPEMEVRTAVRISVCIPFYFQAVIIDNKGKVMEHKKDKEKGNVMVDGGILLNYPIHIFDYHKYIFNNQDSTKICNTETLGLRLDSDNQISYDNNSQTLAPYQITKFKHFTGAFYNIVIENLNRQNLTKEDWLRTVSISSSGFSPKIKMISSEDKNKLILAGKEGIRRYYKL